jgi:hypothetical protein
MDRHHLKSIADQIDTGAGEIESARALIVFNLSDAAVTGLACFSAEIGWPMSHQMPAISVCELAGDIVPTSVRSVSERPDPKGRPDRRRIAFELVFAATEVPAHGWSSYVARYVDQHQGTIVSPNAVFDDRLVVVETEFHDGRYPSSGILSDLGLGML